MAYIHVKKVGKTKYYTLRISHRNENGNVITKDLENLGTDPLKIKIDNLEKKYKKEIKSSYKVIKKFCESNYYLNQAAKKKLKISSFFTVDNLNEIEACKLHFENKFLRLDKQTKREIYELFLIKFAVSSTGIEGNTITLSQASRLLTEEIMPANKTMREIYDLQNTKTVFFDLLENKLEISHELIKEVHDQLLKNIDARKGYRTHDIHIVGQPFKPSPARYVQTDMELLLQWYKKQEQKIHPLALALLFHHKMENIHPFSDGNGRTGRILLNLILLKKGYPPMIIPKALREEYLLVMSKADKGLEKSLFNQEIKNYQPLLSFGLAEFKKTYWNTFLV